MRETSRIIEIVSIFIRVVFNMGVYLCKNLPRGTLKISAVYTSNVCIPQ